MKAVLIILLVIGSFVLSLYKRFKRTLDETSDNAEADDQYYETTGDDEEDVDVVSNPYFSYEYESSKPPVSPWTSKSANFEPDFVANAQPMELQSKAPAFDLRQAVIYHTVLNNQYVDEINQINQ